VVSKFGRRYREATNIVVGEGFMPSFSFNARKNPDENAIVTTWLVDGLMP
jgi:hypothetical protein